MKAESLRIGNWVSLYDDYNSQVTGLTNTKKVWCVDDPTDKECAWSTDKIKPIPLTEEWLLKFGFESERTDENDWYFKENEFCSFGLALLKDSKGWMFYTSETELNHVHQLQNLYHALTGKELTL